jgi:nucleotide-binding universal stress UspA family protein
MSFKTLLAHAEPAWGSDDALTAAMQVAELFGAHIIGVGAEAFELPEYAFIEGGLVQMLRDEIDVDLAAAEKRFMAAVKGNPGGATFVSGMDRPAVLMARHARGADLIVARRVPPGASGTNLCHPADLFMETGAPVLIAPEGAPALDGRRVTVAWKDCREARRALADALPFLQRAEQVQLVQVCPATDHSTARTYLREVVERLARHGVKAEVKVMAPSGASVTTDIEDSADALGADLIVAGAYSHHRMREWVLGGTTQDFVEDCSRYVLFSR